MQGLRPITRHVLRTGRPVLTGHLYTPPVIGCSHWTRRAYATNLPAGNEEIEDDDLFGESNITTSKLAEVSQDAVFENELNEDIPLISDDQLGSLSRDQLLHRPKLPGSIKRLNRILGRQRKVEIPESELDEKFVRGRGPGGQAINKTNSSVSLTHIPTGIRVQSQPTRSREENRKVARRILGERLGVLKTTGQLPLDYDFGGVVVDTPNSPHNYDSTVGKGEGGVEGKKKNKSKIEKKEEEKVLSGKYTKKEIKNEKERIRKLNRAKKAKKKYGTKKNEDVDEDGDEVNTDVDVNTDSSEQIPIVGAAQIAKPDTRV